MNPLHWLEQHPNAALVAVVGGSVLLLFFAAWIVHWWVVDVRYWLDWLPRRKNLPGPNQRGPERTQPGTAWAGEPYRDEWDADWQAEPWTDADADQLIADLRDDGPDLFITTEWHDIRAERAVSPALVESLTDDPDLLLWDIRCQVTRIQEIRAELADLKRELCPA